MTSSVQIKLFRSVHFKNDKIEFIYDTVPLEIDSNGEGCVGSIKVQNVKTKEIQDLKVDGVFPYILVLRQMLKTFQGRLCRMKEDLSKVDEQMRTSTMGVFCGRRCSNYTSKTGDNCSV